MILGLGNENSHERILEKKYNRMVKCKKYMEKENNVNKNRMNSLKNFLFSSCLRRNHELFQTHTSFPFTNKKRNEMKKIVYTERYTSSKWTFPSSLWGVWQQWLCRGCFSELCNTGQNVTRWWWWWRRG